MRLFVRKSTFDLKTLDLQLYTSFLRDNPAWIFLAIAILPGFAVPSSPLMILAGLVWGATWQACAIALAATALNIIWSHLLASGPARQLLTRLIGHRLERFRNLSTADQFRAVILIRLTPGIPLCVQNYGLGLLGTPLRLSLLLALPTTGLHICGLVLTGGAIFDGRTGLLILGVSLFVIATLAIHLIRSKVNQR